MPDASIQQTLAAAMQHHQAGRLPEAEKLYRQILSVDPNHFIALHHLGLIAHQAGRNDIAVDLIRRAAELKPNWPEAFSNLGKILTELQRSDEAIAACRQAITLRPGYADAYCNLAIALKDKGKINEAISASRQAILLRHDFPEAHNLLGLLLAKEEKFSEAIAACRQSISLRPNFAQAYNNLGIALFGGGEWDEGIAACRRAVELEPGFLEAHRNLAYVWKQRGNLSESLACWRRVVALSPNHAEAHFNIATIQLSRGELVEGFREYEWRWKCADFTLREPNFSQPLWDGSPLHGLTLLLYTEQGYGDALQFIRYCDLAAERGGKVIVLCDPELRRLFEISFPQCQFITKAQPLPAFDCHASIMSVPRILGTTLQTIPAKVPYLRPSPADSQRWRDRIAEISAIDTKPDPHGAKVNNRKIGLVWRGAPRYQNDRNRSIPLEKLLPLAEIAGVRLFNLRKGEMSEEDKKIAATMSLIDWTGELTDFADTAGLIDNLDLIITVDTAAAHLAGAMGKPVWILLPHDVDWRWMLARANSPWYPTMQLFRQKEAGDWDNVVRDVISSLRLNAP